MVPALLITLTLAVASWFPIRRWMGRWGTALADLTRVMAGDGLIVHPTCSGHDGRHRQRAARTCVALAGSDGLSARRALQLRLARPPLRLPGSSKRHRHSPGLSAPRRWRRNSPWAGPKWPVAIVGPHRALVLDMRNLGDLDWVRQFGLYPSTRTHATHVAQPRVRTHTVDSDVDAGDRARGIYHDAAHATRHQAAGRSTGRGAARPPSAGAFTPC